MHILKKSVLFLVAIHTLTFCPACAHVRGQTPTPLYTENRGDAAASRESGENVSTAAAEIPGNQAGIYAAEPQRFSREDIQRFLSHCADSIVTLREEDANTTAKYSGNSKNGKEILYLESTGYHPHSVFQYYSQEKFDIYHEYPIYSSEYLYETNSQYSVGWMFTEPKDFSFASAGEAEEEVCAALSALGVSDLTLLRTLYIDHHTMEEAGKKIATDPAYAPIGETQENNGYRLRDDWSEADDAYMFSFGITVGDAVLSTRFEIRETATYTGSTVIVWYSADGIDFLSVDMPWKVGELVQGPEELVPVQAAIEVAREKMEGILTFQNILYSDAVLEYQYRQEKNSWILFPVWTVKVSYQFKDSPGTNYDYICVDALTGAEL